MHHTSKIYLIGGLPRCGKSSLSEYILIKDHMTHTSLDILQSLLHAVDPALGIDVDMGHEQKVEKFTPILHMLIKTLFYYNASSVVEGDAIVPLEAAVLREKYSIQSLFLGDSSLTPELLRKRTGKNDWITEKSEAELQELTDWIVTKSLWLEKECQIYGFPYVELCTMSEEELEKARMKLIRG